MRSSSPQAVTALNVQSSRISNGSARLVARCSLLVAKFYRLQAAGFTLLEILVAVLILGIVVTTVLSSFNMVFSNAETLEATASVFDMGRTCLTRITRDLENVVILERPLYKAPQVDGAPDPYRLQGSVDNSGGMTLAKLRFTSRAHVPLDGSRSGGIAEIVYYVQSVPGEGLRLKRADNLYPYPRFEERSVDPVLCENVKSLAFEYVDAEGTVFDAWDSESPRFGNATPVMVAVRLEIGDGNDSYGFQTTVALPMVRRKSG
jgi:prepilin-type N-terminal cleavage/methylation domain-containing protein